MSPFSYKPIWLHEADDTNQPTNVTPNTDTNADQTSTQQTTTTQVQQQTPQQQNNTPQDNIDNDSMGEPQPAGYDNNGDEDNQDNNDTGDQPMTPNETDNPAKEKDRQIFDSLSPQEQQIKVLKLKELYSNLYDSIEQIIKKYDTLGIKFEDYSEPILKSLNSLYELKDMISTYILYLFDSKTYIENDIMFNRYLTVLNTIKNATDELCKIKSGEIKDAQILK